MHSAGLDPLSQKPKSITELLMQHDRMVILEDVATSHLHAIGDAAINLSEM